MNNFNPGEGWREVTGDELGRTGEMVRWTDRVGKYRAWVREEPVPPLPTEPYTVIRTIPKTENPGHGGVWHRTDSAGAWWQPIGGGSLIKDSTLLSRITGFEVLAVPPLSMFEKGGELRQQFDEVRRETAKAVLDRVRSLHDDEGGLANLHVIAREFGVEVSS